MGDNLETTIDCPKDCAGMKNRDGSDSELKELLNFLVKIQSSTKQLATLHLYDDGEGAIVHCLGVEDEELVTWNNLDELRSLIKKI